MNDWGHPYLVPAPDPDLRAQAEALAPICKELRDEIRDFLAARCPACERDVSNPENRDRLKDPAFCEQGGGPAVTDGHGVFHKAELRCPFKDH